MGTMQTELTHIDLFWTYKMKVGIYEISIIAFWILYRHDLKELAIYFWKRELVFHFSI